MPVETWSLLTPPSFYGLHSMNYNGNSVSELEKIAKSLIFFVESIASSKKKQRGRVRSSPNGRPWSQAFLEETLETGDKNHDDFRCMQMSLVMSMRFIFGDD
ncbi:unnamed protein product [Porites evermanni]|uniref:Uncharacterized protein n=1 Tax=Porites evermanni TaxID=104178 RepID=A0ABN8QI54_9CNID|nr:unnamed protein product [Porites evermanni]